MWIIINMDLRGTEIENYKQISMKTKGYIMSNSKIKMIIYVNMEDSIAIKQNENKF